MGGPHRADPVGRAALVPARDIIAELPQLAGAVARGAIDVRARPVPLAEAIQAWTADTDNRSVLVPLAPEVTTLGSTRCYRHPLSPGGARAMRGRRPAVADRLWMMPEVLIGLAGESAEVAE